tara:strand:- start:889 stop:1566 length:678 start_codon:yes stop_codon:yes gene_type:complete
MVKTGANSVIEMLKLKYQNKDFQLDKTGCKLVEIINCNFEADKPFLLRPKNEDYIRREIEWYMSQSLNVNDMEKPVPKVWKQVATPNGFVNSNYGNLVFSEQNYDQYEMALNAMCSDIHTRRSIMVYTRPSMHYDYNYAGMNDFTCTNTVQYLYRNGAIHALVNMRSNDAVFGYPNDRAWQDYVLDKFVKDIQDKFSPAKIEKGSILWSAASMHVYEHHFDLLEK